VLVPGANRQRLAKTLNAAYAEGLLSERTLAHRLDVLFASALIDPTWLVGDLTRRGRGVGVARRALAALRERTRVPLITPAPDPPILLALDWTGARAELLVGRHPSCDVILGDTSVSRRHARLTFRDEGWVLQDLDSTNGTRVNGVLVGRSRLHPGDQLALGAQLLQVD
jgi:hypothetical protein